jgi:uncharacterized protein YcfJ
MRLRIASVLAVSAFALASQAALAQGHGFRDGRDDDDYGRYEDAYRGFDQAERYARVIDVDPIVERYRSVEPVRDCRVEPRYEDGRVVVRRRSDPGATLVGGLVGAIIGHNVVADGDRGAGTVAGALIGGALGNHLGSHGYREDYEEPRAYEVERCATRPVERVDERVVGYRVSYVYEGRRYTAQLPYDPGRRLRVDYAARPIG